MLATTIQIPLPAFGQDTEEGEMTRFPGKPDVVEVKDLHGDKIAIEANGASVLVSIFSSQLSKERKPKNEKSH